MTAGKDVVGFKGGAGAREVFDGLPAGVSSFCCCNKTKN
jgi:hypothetical protein